MDYVTDELEKGNYVVGVYLDIKKAFDCVNFEILYNKLIKYGIRGQSLKLIKSYLTNRKQKVKLTDENGTDVFSELSSITCGVPQGSVLGPLLFLIYVNDLQNASNLFHAITFADDTNLFMAAPCMVTLCDSVNTELKNIKTWLDSNRLCLNVSKTCFQLYTKKPFDVTPEIRINDVGITREKLVKFLGVIVDERLTFKQHIDSVAAKFAMNIGFLYRGREILTCIQLKLLYNAILLPHLTYCNLVWGINYPTHLNRLHLLQKRAARVILGLGYIDSVKHRLQEVGIIAIDELIQKRCMLLVYKIKHSMAPSQMQHLLHWRLSNSNVPRVRNRGPMMVPFARTKYKQHTFKIFAPKLFNSLSEMHAIDLNVPISAYKTNVAKCMASNRTLCST